MKSRYLSEQASLAFCYNAAIVTSPFGGEIPDIGPAWCQEWLGWLDSVLSAEANTSREARIRRMEEKFSTYWSAMMVVEKDTEDLDDLDDLDDIDDLDALDDLDDSAEPEELD